jgi:hypothetical protein
MLGSNGVKGIALTVLVRAWKFLLFGNSTELQVRSVVRVKPTSIWLEIRTRHGILQKSSESSGFRKGGQLFD